MIERRLQQARSELKQVGDYKYALVNDVLDQAAAEMRAIVLYERASARDAVAAWRRGAGRRALAAAEAVLASFGVHRGELWTARSAGDRRMHEITYTPGRMMNQSRGG